MHTLPVSSCLPVEHSVFVFRQHLTLLRHLMLPSFEGLRRLTLFSKRGLDDVNDAVDLSEALSLSEFTRYGEFPGDFPEE